MLVARKSLAIEEIKKKIALYPLFVVPEYYSKWMNVCEEQTPFQHANERAPGGIYGVDEET
jgi:hypothetical protein